MSSKRALRRKSCKGKRAFTGREEALVASRAFHHKHAEWLWPYRCRFCPFWHLGHLPYRVRQSIASRRGEEIYGRNPVYTIG